MAKRHNGITDSSITYFCYVLPLCLCPFAPLRRYAFFLNFGHSKPAIMKVLYNIGIFIFTVLAHLISPFNSKASLWVKGRKKWAEKIGDKIKPEDRTVWIHC